MKKYNTVFDLEKELISKGYSNDGNVPADFTGDEGYFTDLSGNSIIWWEDYKVYGIILSK